MLTLVATLVLTGPMEVPGWGRRFFAEHADVLDHATRVEAFRLVSHNDDEAWRTGKKPVAETFNGYVVTARTGPLPVAFLGRAAALFLSDSTYPQPQQNTFMLKLCGGIHPGIGFRFTRGRQTTDVLVCLQCNDVGVVVGISDKGKGLDYWPDGDLDPMRPHDLRVVDSSPGRRNLLVLAAEAFPQDAELKKAGHE